MDQMKIGKFIASMRKKQGLSQKQLAERIDVTDKTISKWETGNRLPDASILLRLSQELQIDVNELLAGEAFSSEEFSAEEYVQKSESNLVELVDRLNENEKKRKGRGIGTAAGILCIAFAFAGVLESSLPMGKVSDIFDFRASAGRKQWGQLPGNQVQAIQSRSRAGIYTQDGRTFPDAVGRYDLYI